MHCSASRDCGGGGDDDDDDDSDACVGASVRAYGGGAAQRTPLLHDGRDFASAAHALYIVI